MADSRTDRDVIVSIRIRRYRVVWRRPWGHDDPEVRGREVARARPGVNYNLLADETLMDVPSRNTNLNAIPVEVMTAV